MTNNEIRNLPTGARQAFMLGAEAHANGETFMETADDIAHYYGKTWREMTKEEKLEARKYFSLGYEHEDSLN